MIFWEGFISLQPGHSWGFILSPLDYARNMKPGKHRIQFEMGGIRSNILEIVWPKSKESFLRP